MRVVINGDRHETKMKTAIIVADSHGEPFDSIRSNIWDRNWSQFISSGYKVYKYIGEQNNIINSHSKFSLEKLRYSKFWPIQYILDKAIVKKYNFRNLEIREEADTLYVNLPEGLKYLGVKTFCVLKYLFDNGYELVYKTTMSSITNLKFFNDYVSSIDTGAEVYAGTLMEREYDFDYISGANLFISRTAFKYLESNRSKWNHAKLEDVAIGELLYKNVILKKIESLNISNIEELHSVDEYVLNNVFHIRCTSRNGKVRGDLEILNNVLDLLKR